MKKYIIIIGILLTFTGKVLAATYFVDVQGDDHNSGNLDAPFATIQKGVDNATDPGDRVCVGNGIYYQTVKIYKNSGTKNQPIDIRNCDGGQVSIEPSERIVSWERIGSRLYESNQFKTSLFGFFWKNQVWMGLPTDCGALNSDGKWCVTGDHRIRLYSNSSPNDAPFWIVGDDIVGVDIRNVHDILIEGISVKWSVLGYQIGSSYANPLGTTTNITVENAEVAYAGSRGIRVVGSNKYPTSYITLDTMTVHGSRDPGGQNGHCIKFDSNEKGYHNSHVLVRNSTIYDCWYHGIQCSNGWRDAEFANNVIYDVSQRGSGAAAAIRCGTTINCSIHDNTLYGGSHPYGSGIYLQENPSQVRVYRNKISGFDWHGIYVFNTEGGDGINDAQIYNNLIYDNKTTGIKIEASKDLKIYNNMIDNNGTNPHGLGIGLDLATSKVKGVDLKNSIIASDKSLGMHVADGASVMDSYNVWFRGDSSDVIQYQGKNYRLQEYQSLTGKGTNSVQQNPQFINVSKCNFRLKTRSIALNHGMDLSEYFVDDFSKAGRKKPWAIGAYGQ